MSYQIGKNIRINHSLKDEIYKRGHSIKEFSERIQINRRTMNYWFKGEHIPSEYCIQLISNELNIPYEKTKKICLNK